MTAPWTKTDVRRAIQAVETGDKCAQAVEFLPDGAFRVLIGKAPEAPVVAPADWTDLAGQKNLPRA